MGKYVQTYSHVLVNMNLVIHILVNIILLYYQ